MYLNAEPTQIDQRGYGGYVLNDNFAANADVMYTHSAVYSTKASSSKTTPIDLYLDFVEIIVLEHWWDKLKPSMDNART